MNTLMLVALAVVLLCYCGGRFCPSVLKQNKELVLGVLVGMALCSFAGLKLEGFDVTTPEGAADFQDKCCDFVNDTIRNRDSLLTEYVYPECNDNRDENQGVKQALCSQASTNRKYKDLSGPPGKAQFKQNCCGENSVPFSIVAGSESDQCFEYAIGTSITEFIDSGISLAGFLEQYNNMCSP